MHLCLVCIAWCSLVFGWFGGFHMVLWVLNLWVCAFVICGVRLFVELSNVDFSFISLSCVC